ncbi:MAG: biopolymer transporter ExbD [Gammaproteobacteria bacterium]|nr:biopolymer transporter ExbD [Gammaproteobacteria bacterium]
MQLELPSVRKKRLVGITPLIDVVFILLLFFMLASNFQQWQAMPLSLAGQNDNLTELDTTLGIYIGDGGDLTLNGTPVALEKLTAMLEREVASGTEPRLLIETNRSTALQTLVHVIDRVSSAGIENITFGGISP